MPFNEAFELEKFLAELDMYDLLVPTVGKIVFVLRARTAGTRHRCDVGSALRFANLDILRMLMRDMNDIAAQPVTQSLNSCM